MQGTRLGRILDRSYPRNVENNLEQSRNDRNLIEYKICYILIEIELTKYSVYKTDQRLEKKKGNASRFEIVLIPRTFQFCLDGIRVCVIFN